MQKKYYFILAFFSVIYALLSFATPLDHSTLMKYSLTNVEARIIGLSIIIPLIAIWFAAFYGFSKVKNYAHYIGNDADGRSLNLLANGLMILGIGLPIVSISSEFVSYLSSVRLDLVPKGVIIANYIGIAVASGAFTLIYQGSVSLAKITHKHFSKYGTLLFTTPFCIFSLGYVYFVLKSTTKSSLATSTSHGTYYLPNWLILLTILVPFLAIWYIGLRSAALISFYRRHVAGMVYKKALGLLSLGVATVIITSILEQLLTLLGSHFSGFSIAAILVLVYVLIAIIGLGYILIAVGANRLRKIEEA